MSSDMRANTLNQVIDLILNMSRVGVPGKISENALINKHMTRTQKQKLRANVLFELPRQACKFWDAGSNCRYAMAHVVFQQWGKDGGTHIILRLVDQKVYFFLGLSQMLHKLIHTCVQKRCSLEQVNFLSLVDQLRADQVEQRRLACDFSSMDVNGVVGIGASNDFCDQRFSRHGEKDQSQLL